MEMTTDGAIRGGSCSDKIETTAMHKMIELFCGEIFEPNFIQAIREKRATIFCKSHISDDIKFIITLNKLKYKPKSSDWAVPFIECYIEIIDITDIEGISHSDILPGLCTGKFDNQASIGDWHDFILDHHSSNILIGENGWKYGYYYSHQPLNSQNSEFMRRLISWSNKYINDITNTQEVFAKKQDLYGEKDHPTSCEASEILSVQPGSTPEERKVYTVEMISQDKIADIYEKEAALKYLKDIDIDTYMDIFARTLHEQIHNIMHTDELFAGKDKLTPSDLFAILKIVKQPHVFETVRIMGDK